MTNQQLLAIATLAAMLLTGGMWLGNLAEKVDQLQREQTFYHGAELK